MDECFAEARRGEPGLCGVQPVAQVRSELRWTVDGFRAADLACAQAAEVPLAWPPAAARRREDAPREGVLALEPARRKPAIRCRTFP
jgi:hypothetical protein